MFNSLKEFMATAFALSAPSFLQHILRLRHDFRSTLLIYKNRKGKKKSQEKT